MLDPVLGLEMLGFACEVLVEVFSQAGQVFRVDEVEPVAQVGPDLVLRVAEQRFPPGREVRYVLILVPSPRARRSPPGPQAHSVPRFPEVPLPLSLRSVMSWEMLTIPNGSPSASIVTSERISTGKTLPSFRTLRLSRRQLLNDLSCGSVRGLRSP